MGAMHQAENIHLNNVVSLPFPFGWGCVVGIFAMLSNCYVVLLVFLCVSALWLLVLFPIIGIILYLAIIFVLNWTVFVLYMHIGNTYGNLIHPTTIRDYLLLLKTCSMFSYIYKDIFSKHDGKYLCYVLSFRWVPKFSNLLQFPRGIHREYKIITYYVN